jgi:hypothetical protein
MTTTEEMVAMRVEGGVTAGTREGRELRGKAREAELALEGQAVGVGGKEVVRLAAGKGAEGMASGRAEEGRKVLDNMGRGSFGQGGRHAAQVLAAKVTTEVLEVKGISENSEGAVGIRWKMDRKKRGGEEVEELEKAIRGMDPREKEGVEGRRKEGSGGWATIRGGGNTSGRKANGAGERNNERRYGTDGEGVVPCPTEGCGKGGKKTGVGREGVGLAGEVLEEREEVGLE